MFEVDPGWGKELRISYLEAQVLLDSGHASAASLGKPGLIPQSFAPRRTERAEIDRLDIVHVAACTCETPSTRFVLLFQAWS